MWPCNYICVSLHDKLGGDLWCSEVCFILLSLYDKEKLQSHTIQYQDCALTCVDPSFNVVMRTFCVGYIIPRVTNLVASV